MVAMRIAGLLLIGGLVWGAELDDATRQLSREIFRELIEINTTDSVGSTTRAAESGLQSTKRPYLWNLTRPIVGIESG